MPARNSRVFLLPAEPGWTSRLAAYSVLSILCVAASAGTINGIVPLPNQTQPNVMIRDSAGNLYLGFGANTVPGLGYNPSVSSAGASVAKLSSDGGKAIFQTVLSTNSADAVTALALAPDGSILVAGITKGNFPVTKDAAEPQDMSSSSGNSTGFFVRLDPNGNVVYASYLNPDPSSQSGISFVAMTTDATGAVYLAGQGVFASSPGALPQTVYFGEGYFVVKFDSNGKQVFATGGIGGTAIAVDAQGSIFIAGSAQSGFPIPVTPGALQPVQAFAICGSTAAFGFPCFDQYLAKLDPLASKLIYSTWLSGTDGASPTILLIDGQGNAIVAGYTQSSDYPLTSGAFQTVNGASLPPVDSGFGPFFYPGPPHTGYVSKVDATGTGLLFSTYLGGSSEDSVTAAASDPVGNIFLAGLAGSPDFPGLSGVPPGCRPSYVYQTPYVTRLSADGSSLTATQLGSGLAGPQGNVPAVFDGEGNAVVASNGSLASVSLFAESQKFACATDAADQAPLTQIAPGQLLALFGENIGEPAAISIQPQNGIIPYIHRRRLPRENPRHPRAHPLFVAGSNQRPSSLRNRRTNKRKARDPRPVRQRRRHARIRSRAE